MTISRRDLLQTLGAGAALLPLGACGSSPATASPDAPEHDAPPGSGWASGGTAAMTDKATYPDPFAVAVTSCPLVVRATTAGPCTADAPVRVDVSEGYPGIPVRLALRLVTQGACTPIANAQVEIWHTQVTGVYSGDTPSPGFCSGGDAEAPTKSYFRGTQTTDADGRVAFDTCFPGWYPGRAIHIHFRVIVGGTSTLVSQLFFDQGLVDEIFARHPDYAPEGAPDTSNAADGVARGAGALAPYILDTARMTDGAMLASKTIALA